MKSTVFSVILSTCALGLLACSAESADPENPGGSGGSQGAERTPIGKADSLSGSCAEGDVCGGKSKGSCWCDATCAQYGDCCADYQAACGGDIGCEDASDCGSGKTCSSGECAVVEGRCDSAADCGDGEQCISPACEPGGPCPAGYCVGSASISFDGDFGESVSGKIVAGAKVEISYDADRLTQCRGDQGGHAAWTIYGYYQVNGSDKKPFWVAGHSSTGQTTTPVIVPHEPGELEIWFENTNMWGCIAYDSNLGQNYRFEVAPLGG